MRDALVSNSFLIARGWKKGRGENLSIETIPGYRRCLATRDTAYTIFAHDLTSKFVITLYFVFENTKIETIWICRAWKPTWPTNIWEIFRNLASFRQNEIKRKNSRRLFIKNSNFQIYRYIRCVILYVILFGENWQDSSLLGNLPPTHRDGGWNTTTILTENGRVWIAYGAALRSSGVFFNREVRQR